MNQLKMKDKNYYYMIVFGIVCQVLSIVCGLLFFFVGYDTLTSITWLFRGSGALMGVRACVIFGAIFAIAGSVLALLGRNPLYHDVNIMSAAFNRETNNGNQIICVDNGGGRGPGPIPGRDPLLGPGATGGVRVLSGQYAGSVIQMQNKERITIGRDKSQCDLVCNSDRVSRVHLSITYFASGMSGPEYIVRDMSSNGTNSSTIGQLPKNQEVRQRPGSVLTLGNSAESIQLL